MHNIQNVIKNKKGYVISLYRLPSQTKNEFDMFLINFEQLIGDIIAKNSLFVITGTLMLDQQIGGRMIFVHLKVLKLIHSPLIMV